MKKELIDFLSELSDLSTMPRNPLYISERSKLLLKSINSDALNETPDVNEHEHQKENWDCQQEQHGYGRCSEICDDCASYPQNQSD